MLADRLADIANLLDTNIDELNMGAPLFTDPRYKARPFDKGNFSPFPSMTLDEAASDGRRLAFVDGGNLEILKAPNFSVHLVRVYFNIFEGERRVMPRSVPQRMEFFVVALATILDGKMYYSGILVPMDEAQTDLLPSGDHLMIDSMDRTIRSDTMGRADISVMGALTRGFAEWHMAALVMEEELREGDILIRDGTLQTALGNERHYAKRAYKAADERGVVLGGVAKTSTLITTTGLSLLAAVNRLSTGGDLEGKIWYYHPVAENTHPDHPAEMFVAKLNPESDYVFRSEVYRPQAEAMGREGVGRFFSLLSSHCCDYTFLGYPYGLVDADQYARVPRHQAGEVRTLMGTTLSGMDCHDKIMRHLQAMNAHDILDAI